MRSTDDATPEPVPPVPPATAGRATAATLNEEETRRQRILAGPTIPDVADGEVRVLDLSQPFDKMFSKKAPQELREAHFAATEKPKD